MSKIIHIESPTQFSQLLTSSRVVVADFYADWCGPCKAIAPYYEKLAADLSRPDHITFTKINTDNQREISQMYQITAMPTFMIFKAGRETKRIRGADPKALDAAIKSLAEEAASSSSSSSASASASAGGNWVGASLPRAYTNVTENVDLLNLDFLNVSSDAGDSRSVFTTTAPSALSKARKDSDNKDWIESDTDQQLMLYIPFQATLKVHTLHITSIPPTDDEEVTRPSSIRLYINKSNVLSFDEAESVVATQTIELKPEDWDPKTHTAKLELRFVKFQSCTSIVIFVAEGENEDAERTRVDRIRIVGETGEKRGMGKLEKIGDEQGE